MTRDSLIDALRERVCHQTDIGMRPAAAMTLASSANTGHYALAASVAEEGRWLFLSR